MGSIEYNLDKNRARSVKRTYHNGAGDKIL